ATPSYPGQIMSLSRQASQRIREPSVQDRLVITSETVAQASSSQAAGTMYGVAGMNCDDKDVSFLTRSESCLSSHMSSPDIFTATAMDPGLAHAYRSTHIVEHHDIHARGYDQARRQLFKQQLQNKAAQRRSWHFDDRNGAYIVTDLINNRPCAPLPAHVRPRKDPEEEKPPIPPRRDKLISPPAPKRLPGNEAVSLAQNSSDLMVLEDPIVTAPGKTNQNFSDVTGTVESSVKRNTNPFIDDTVVNTSQMLSDLQRSTLSNTSWETQSWPEPPSESEILGQTAPAVPSNSSTATDKSAPIVYSSQLKTVPESLQYQPQNYGSHPRKPDQQDESKIPYNTLKSNESQNKPSKTNHTDRSHRHKKGTGGKITPPSLEAQIPVMKEYDNPLFKAQAPDGDRPVTLGETFSLQICESTSFVHPSPEQPPPSSFYAAVGNTKSDPSSLRRHSGHFTYTPILEDGGNVGNPISHVSYDPSRNNPPPSYSRYNNRRPEDTLNKHSSPKDKPRSNSKQHHQQNGIVKSRPRQVKREHQQRRNGHPDPGNPPQYQTTSPHTGRYGSSPDLVSKSPRVGRRRPDSAGTYGYDTNRQTQSPYYSVQPGQYRHWGDSDL
ncbi:unnamed protein product, partial [Candidula unifasciata]